MTARPRNKRTTEQSGETVKTAAGAATKARTGWSPAVSVRWLEIPKSMTTRQRRPTLSLLAGPAKIRALVSRRKRVLDFEPISVDISGTRGHRIVSWRRTPSAEARNVTLARARAEGERS
jgi:hypothetical protein